MGDYPLGQLSQGSCSEGGCLRGCCLIIVSKRQDKFQAHLNTILGSMRQSTMFAFSNYVSIHMSAVYYRKQIIIHCQVCKYNVAQRFQIFMKAANYELTNWIVPLHQEVAIKCVTVKRKL